MRGPGVLVWALEHVCALFSLPQETWQDLLASSKFNKHESFTVVFQPFFYEVDPPSVSEPCEVS